MFRRFKAISYSRACAKNGKMKLFRKKHYFRTIDFITLESIGMACIREQTIPYVLDKGRLKPVKMQ